MATVEVTTQNFEEVVSNNNVVLIDFWAEWCGPCRVFGPVYEKVSGAHPDVVFGKVDTEAQQELAASFNIMSIPTLMIIREGVVLYSQAGALPEKALVDVVDQALKIDMVEVHRQLAEAGAGAAND
ncbi:MAG TPA: thioredoxin [Acidimicrobiales bacterium]|nr:thioredoxin [Acidimicrobiales bacterium]